MSVPDDPEHLKRLYLPPTDQFVIIDVPEMQFVMIEGDGDHEAESFVAGTGWLQAALNPIKRIAKQRMGARFVEPPLEVLCGPMTWRTSSPGTGRSSSGGR